MNNKLKESNKKIDLLNNQLSEEKNKNNILSKESSYIKNKMKESNKKINLLDNQLTDEEKKNSDYKNIIEELNSKINEQNKNQKEINKLYKKIVDLDEKLKRYPFILEENEKLISVIISSINQRINYSMICKNTFTINDLEKELYKEYPEISETDNYFMCKGNIINRLKTFESNHIENGDLLILMQKN